MLLCIVVSIFSIRNALADTILFPVITKNAPNVVSFISVINDSGQASHLKYIYRYKDPSANVNAPCDVSSFVRPTLANDLVSFDVSGAFNGGYALFNDGNNYGGPFNLTADGAKRAYLLVTHSDSTGSRVDVGKNKSLKGEAIIMDIAYGAAWGYKAINDKDREDFTFTNAGVGEALETNYGSPFGFFPLNEWTTRIFVTPIGSSMDSASVNGQVNLGTIYNRDAQGISSGISKGLSCLAAINVQDFMDASTQASLASTGGWSYFKNEGSSPVLAYKLEYVVNNPTYGGTNNNAYCLSCEKESMSTTPTPSGKTWTINIIAWQGAYLWQLILTTDPTNNKMFFTVTNKNTSGSKSFFCSEMTFIQSGKQFELTTYTPNSQTEALVTGNDGWDCSGGIYAGLTKSAVISNIPSWFNFNSPFTFFFDFICYPSYGDVCTFTLQ